MTLTAWIRFMAGIVVLAILVAIAVAWRAEVLDRAGLAAELTAAKTALEAAEARQQERDSKLAVTLAALAKQKRAVQSPAQIVKDLPLQMHLPVAIALQDAPIASGTLIENTGDRSSKSGDRTADTVASNPQAVIPYDDLKPMYDFSLDCQACQASLAAAQSNLTDEQGKTRALIKERDDALRVARGGTILRRIARATKWMLIGAAAGAVAARAMR
jgi:hypothetical protein